MYNISENNDNNESLEMEQVDARNDSFLLNHGDNIVSAIKKRFNNCEEQCLQ